MKKIDLARRLARAGRITKAEAADRLDSVIHNIVRSLRRGQSARLPGLGTFQPGSEPGFQPEVNPAKRETGPGPSTQKGKS
jgi:nucleoid DNA-binding protein